MNLTPATLRLDLKCGRGAISEGEKCTKGPATKVESKPASGSRTKNSPSVAESRRAKAKLQQGGLTTSQKVILGAYAVAGASTLYKMRNMRKAYEAKFSPAQRFKPFTEDIGGVKNVLQNMTVRKDKAAGPSLFGDVTFGTHKGKDVVAKKIGGKGLAGSMQVLMMQRQGIITEKTSDALLKAQKNLQVNEVQAAQLAGKHGFGPKFVAAGNNTLITEAARGRPLASQDRALRYMQGKGQQEMQQDPGKFFKKALALQWRGFTKGTELSSTNKARIVENLGRMHTLGISHNDLHPGNVFISSKGAEFIDFGTSERGGGAVASEFVRLMNKPRAGLQQAGGMGYNLRTVNPAAYKSAESAIKKAIGKRVGALTSADIQNALKKSKNAATLESSLQRIVDDYYLQMARGQRTDAALTAGAIGRLDACWEGYVQAGMKRKGKRRVPNCIPASSGLAKPRKQQDTEDDKKYTKQVRDPKTGRTRTVRYGAKGYRIAPGTDKGDRYCARSFGDMKSEGYNCAGAERNTPLCLSRAKWRCSGKTSRRDSALTPGKSSAW
jgi:predicted Ser/Thr protein kinase